jgi:hypothetical protein
LTDLFDEVEEQLRSDRYWTFRARRAVVLALVAAAW